MQPSFMKPNQHEIGVGATEELSLRVSVAALVSVLFDDPEDGRTMLDDRSVLCAGAAVTRSLGKELGSCKIRLNSINSGMVEAEGTYSQESSRATFANKPKPPRRWVASHNHRTSHLPSSSSPPRTRRL